MAERGHWRYDLSLDVNTPLSITRQAKNVPRKKWYNQVKAYGLGVVLYFKNVFAIL